MLGDIAIGTQTLAKGLSLLNKPSIRVYVVIPLLINLLLFGALVWFGYQQFYALVEWLMSFVPGFLDFLQWLLWLFFGLLAAVTVFFAFTPVANIVAAPFNALMSEKIEELLTGKPPASDSSFMQMAIDSVVSQLGKLLYISLWASGLLLLSLIPLINFIVPVLWVVFGSWLLSLEYLDYPMGNHDIAFAKQKEILRKRRGLSLGFGGSVMIMTSIPIINFFAMPVAVAGATVLWVEQLQADQ